MNHTHRRMAHFRAALSWLLPASLLLAAVFMPTSVWAQSDLGAEKLSQLQSALRTVAISAIGIAGILAGVYIAFGRQDGNEKIGNVIKGAIIISVITGAVSWLAS